MRRFVGAALAAAAAALAGAPAASAEQFDIVPDSFKAFTSNQDSNPETQAGAHPFSATTQFKLTVDDAGFPKATPKEMRFKLPQGFVGNPESLPKCPRAVFALVAGGSPGVPPCPIGSQVGVADVETYSFGQAPFTYTNYPVYLLEASDGNVAELGFPVISVPVFVKLRVDSANDSQLEAQLTRTSDAVPVTGSKLTLWGVPADPAHDALRACGNYWPSEPCASDQPQRPFLTNPASCDLPQTTNFSVNSWQFQDDWRSASYRAPDATGCDRLKFKPGFGVSTETSAPDAPSGLNVDISLPQDDDPATGLAPPALKDARVTMPEGMTINPGSAGGLEACSDGQLGLKSDSPVGCPGASKIGTVTAETPVLPENLEGSVYLRSQNSGDPESGEMFRIALVLKNEKRGLLFKLPGQVRANSRTGRLETTFLNNPQLPMSRFRLAFKTGPRAPLATPPDCGSQQVQAHLTSWGGQAVDLASPVSVSCTPGLGGFSPSLKAGTARPVGGAFSPFLLNISKPDGNAPLNGLRMGLPTGLLAKLKGNLGQQVGNVTAFAGSGSSPYPLPGKVFLEGRYGDAPFSLKVVVPAKAGPFDLGEVVVKQKIYVDSRTAAVSIVSDPLPTIVGGVPVRLQRLDVNVDKPGFIVNPTSCAAKQIGSRLSAADGQSVPINVRFQVSDCSRLALSPKLSLRLTGGQGQLTDGKHPGLKAVLTQKVGQANLKKAMVKLPLSLALDPDNAQGLCEYTDSLLVDPKCPKSSIVGSATAFSPILNQKLTAPVYFAKNVRVNKYGRQVRTLPNLVLPFRGENGLKLNVIANSSVSRGKLVNTFKTVPDAPVSYFALNIKGGANGILVANSSVCKRDRKAYVQIDGHNNKPADSKPTIKAACAKASKKSKKTKARSRR